MRSRLWSLVTIGALGVVLSVSPIGAAAESEVVIGRLASGQLAVLVEFGGVLELERSVFPGAPGFATGLAGFHSTEIDIPAEGVLVLDPGASIAAELVGADAGVRVFDGPHLMAVGDRMLFGAPFFDYHPIFNIVAGNPGERFELRFVAHDLSGHHADSEEFTLAFTPAFCRADFNRDGNADPDDLSDFITVYFTEPRDAAADFNGDGTIDPDDLGDFITVYFVGCA